MIVKMTIDLARGFAPWKEMFIKNEYRLNEHGGKLVFAGTEKDNDNKLTVIMDFDTPEALQNFASDEALSKIRSESGAILETATATIMSSDSFTKT
ncbi:MAG: hypothetical protein CMN50_04555 [SAR116 cluster bacterium]|nr:hypothetical protein [SAR116 cluster bacterium]|tara:strand:- start:245 stop:532 length:288 start_codon:yes stop_codon:yes gene_type:complete